MERERERYIATWMLSLLASGKGFNGFVFHEANNSAPLQSLLVHFSLAFFFHSASLTLSLSLSLCLFNAAEFLLTKKKKKKKDLAAEEKKIRVGNAWWVSGKERLKLFAFCFENSDPLSLCVLLCLWDSNERRNLFLQQGAHDSFFALFFLIIIFCLHYLLTKKKNCYLPYFTNLTFLFEIKEWVFIFEVLFLFFFLVWSWRNLLFWFMGMEVVLKRMVFYYLFPLFTLFFFFSRLLHLPFKSYF